MAVLAIGASIFSTPMLSAPVAAADGCPDVDVVFARGTDEPPGVGVIGGAFIDALRADTSRTLTVYAVNYPASRDYATGVACVVDAGNHVRDMAASCPATRMVLGGYSQGAGVMALLTSDGSSAGSAALPGLPGALPPAIADHVAAVALFGKPSAELLNSLGMPPIAVGPLYAGRTIDLCVTGDPICTVDQGNSIVPHLLYGVNGMAAQAADFAARRL